MKKQLHEPFIQTRKMGLILRVTVVCTLVVQEKGIQGISYRN